LYSGSSVSEDNPWISAIRGGPKLLDGNEAEKTTSNLENERSSNKTHFPAMRDFVSTLRRSLSPQKKPTAPVEGQILRSPQSHDYTDSSADEYDEDETRSSQGDLEGKLIFLV
jgi:hypothetical protein